MEERRMVQPEEQEGRGMLPVPLGLQVKSAGGALLVTGLIDVFAHGGWTGLLVGGGIAAIIAWRHGPEVVSGIQQYLPMQEAPHRKVPKHQRTFWQRALGIEPDEVLPVERLDDEALPEIVSDDVISLNSSEANEVYQRFNSQPVPSSYTSLPRPQEQVRASNSDDVPSPVSIRSNDRAREVLLAENLGIDIDEVIEAGVFVAGMKGSGKSSLAAKLMEQVGKYPLPQIIFDIKGDFVSLINSHFLSGMLMTAGQEFDAATILSSRLQVVVDLRTWDTMDERADIIATLNQSLLHYAMSLQEVQRIPWFMHLDEAQQFVAQQQPVGIEPATWKKVTQSVTNLGVLGRAYGAVPCLYTQRIASIHKDVVSQQELRVFMKASLDNDLKRYEEYINARVARREDIQAFRAGDAVVLLPDGGQHVIHFLPRESKHGSHTPHLEQALQASQKPVIREQHAQMPHSWGYRSMPQQVYNTIAMQEMSPIKQPRMSELQRLAYEQWKQGVRGPRPLERALGVTYYQAKQLNDQLEEWQKKGMID